VATGAPPGETPPPDTPPLRTPAGAFQWVGLVAVAVVTIVADQVTKWVARATLLGSEPVDVLPFFSLTYARNTGIAFGQFQDRQAIVIVLSFVAIGWMVYYFARAGGRHPLLPAAIGLLMGGAASNLFDRLRQGYVTDFLALPNFPIFNLADTAITMGVILLLISLVRGERSAPS
jgi:signal peptidase II